MVHNGLQYLAQLGLDDTGIYRLFTDPLQHGYNISYNLLNSLTMPQLFVWWVRRGGGRGPCRRAEGPVP